MKRLNIRLVYKIYCSYSHDGQSGAKNGRKALCKNRLVYDLVLLNYKHVYDITYNLYWI